MKAAVMYMLSAAAWSRASALVAGSSRLQLRTLSNLYNQQYSRHFTRSAAATVDRRANLLRASAATEINGRLNADGISFDAQLVAKQPELVLSNLKARRAGEDSVAAVHAIGGVQCRACFHHSVL
jgi:hypothetical protein